MPQRDPVLLAFDDDQEIVETICAIGGRAGFHSVPSTSSGRLRELVESSKPDVIVLDLQMPEQDGVSALRQLADMQCPAKIFLITGMDERTIASAEQYGLRRGLAVFKRSRTASSSSTINRSLDGSRTTPGTSRPSKPCSAGTTRFAGCSRRTRSCRWAKRTA
jgi:CheY-like chemotaxis protein